jgi:DNA-binding NarL/FixJ family response regulator
MATQGHRAVGKEAKFLKTPVSGVATRVVVVDDDLDFLILAKEIIFRAQGLDLAGLFSDAESALAALPKTRPEIVVLDVKLPGMSGLECLHRLHVQWSAIKVLLITGVPGLLKEHEREIARQASGFLRKPFQPGDLVSTLQLIARGHSVWGEALGGTGIARKRPGSSWHPRLSRRENEIMFLLCQHQTDKEIGDALSISAVSVRTHLRSIYKKLGANLREEAVQAYEMVSAGI